MPNPSSPPQFGEWMPIETAPKDETWVLVFGTVKGGVGIRTARYRGDWFGGTWIVSIADRIKGKQIGLYVQEPTHWTPLPPAPASQGDENDER